MLSCCTAPKSLPRRTTSSERLPGTNSPTKIKDFANSLLPPPVEGFPVMMASPPPSTLSDFVAAKQESFPSNSNSAQIGEGTLIKQYKLKGILGEGMQGQVRIAVDPENRDWAMKIVRKRAVFRRGKEGKYGLATGPVAREIAIMKKLVHPNLVSLHEVLDDPNEDKLFLVMELVSGGPVMQDLLEGQEPLDEDSARLYFRQLIRGLEYLHFHNICHRDIKPSNLLVTSKKVLKISDFGVSMLCKSVPDDDQSQAPDQSFKSDSLKSDSVNISSTMTIPPLESNMSKASSSGNIPMDESQSSPDDSVTSPSGVDLEVLSAFDIESVLNNPVAQTPLPTRKIPDTPLPPVTPGKLKLLSKQSSSFTRVDDTVDDATGTVAFYPPEACVPGGKYGGFNADLWAAGATLYMFLFGRAPFVSENQEELFTLIREKELDFPLVMGRPPVSSDAIALLKDMMNKNPAKRPNLQKIKPYKWVLKDGVKIPALTKEEAKNIQVTTAELESAVTHVDLSVAVRLLVRSKSWSNKVQNRVQSNALLRAEIEHFTKPDEAVSTQQEPKSAKKKDAANGDVGSIEASKQLFSRQAQSEYRPSTKLMLDVQSPELVDATGKPKQMRALTMPAPRELRKETGGLVNEFRMKIERPAQTPSALLEEIKRRKLAIEGLKIKPAASKAGDEQKVDLVKDAETKANEAAEAAKHADVKASNAEKEATLAEERARLTEKSAQLAEEDATRAEAAAIAAESAAQDAEMKASEAEASLAKM